MEALTVHEGAELTIRYTDLFLFSKRLGQRLGDQHPTAAALAKVIDDLHDKVLVPADL